MLYDPKWEAPATVEPWRQKLVAAATKIETDGWCQGRASAGKRVCVAQAIYGGGPYDDCKLAMRVMYRTIGGNIAGWNDRPGRTKEEVLAALREAAAS